MVCIDNIQILIDLGVIYYMTPYADYSVVMWDKMIYN